MIIGENVKGLLSRKTSTGEPYVDVIVGEFKKLGYEMIHKVMKADKYGVPQKRERLLLIGVKPDNPYGWKRWEAVMNHMNAQDNSHLLPGLKEYTNKLDTIRGLSATKIFPELAHLL